MEAIMLRPLPPFRVRPLHTAVVRKSVSPVTIEDIGDEMEHSVKAVRRPLRIIKTAPMIRLRVLRDAIQGA
jgi:hypothetical protein